MGAVRDRLNEAGDTTDLVIVTFTKPENLPADRRQHHLDAEMVVDRGRSAYAAFGLGRGSVQRVWGWRMVRRYAEILRADGFAGLRRPTEDTLQLGGDFIIDPEGTLIYAFWSEGPDDRPEVDELIAALH